MSLQRGATDIVNAMDMVAECKEELLEVRRTAEEYSDAVYTHAKSFDQYSNREIT